MGMGKARLWGRRVVLAMAAAGVLLAAGYGYAYLFTERLLTGDTLTTLPALAPGDAVEGARLARVLGCTACHGASLEGLVFIEIPHVARLVAPNLTVVRDHYDDAAFVRLMRAGTKFDGRIPLAMPNKVHQRFTTCSPTCAPRPASTKSRRRPCFGPWAAWPLRSASTT
jgi:hypothetical protein